MRLKNELVGCHTTDRCVASSGKNSLYLADKLSLIIRAYGENRLLLSTGPTVECNSESINSPMLFKSARGALLICEV